MTRRILALAIVLLAMGGAARAAEIDASIATAIKSATDEIIPPFLSANGHALRAFYAPSGALIPRYNGGAPSDVFLCDAPAIDRLIKEGKIVGPSVFLGRTGIGIAVKKGAPHPDVSTPEALRRALLAAKSVGHASTAGGSVTGGHVMRVFERLGIADQIAPKTKLSMGGPNSRVSVLVSSSEAEIGLQQASELLDNPDVEMIGMLPAGLQQITVYAGGVTATARQPEVVNALIAALTTSQAKAIFKAKGLGLE